MNEVLGEVEATATAEMSSDLTLRQWLMKPER